MTEMQIESKLATMVGLEFIYKQKHHKILRYRLGVDNMYITTDQADISFAISNAEIKLKEFLPVQSNAVGVVKKPMLLNVELPNLLINTQGNQLLEIALRNIEAIEKNAANIPKAQAVNEQLKTIIDLCKVEVEGVRAAALIHQLHG